MRTARFSPSRLLRALGIVLLAWLVLSWLVVLLLRFVPPWTSAVMVERQLSALLHGEHDFTLRHHWVPWRDISPYAGIAVVAGEDQKFPFHHGFDFQAIDQAIDAADDGRRLRGASTISQQTAKNLFLWSGRSWFRKGLEAYYTLLMETLWPKTRILEVYVNVAEFGDGIYGAQAAAKRHFGKDAGRLSAGESARLAATLPSPRRYSASRPGPYVQRRAQWIQRNARQIGGEAYLEALK